MSLASTLEERFQQEQTKTKEWLADVMQFLSHDTSPTRRQLAAALRQRAELIESEAQLDSFFAQLPKAENANGQETELNSGEVSDSIADKSGSFGNG